MSTLLIRALSTAASVLCLTCLEARAEVKPNLDFSQSPCYQRATNFNKSIAVRVFAKSQANGSFALVDGRTDWAEDLSGVNMALAMNIALRAPFDGWAVYQLDEASGGKILGISMQYMFGDIAGDAKDCVVLPDALTQVEIADMPAVAVQMYLQVLTGDGSGSEDAMRERFAKVLEEPVAVVAPEQAARQSSDGTPDDSRFEEIPVEVYDDVVRKWDTYCREEGGTSFFDNEYIYIVDVDDNGVEDYVFNGDGASCLKDGQTISKDGGNGGATLTLFLSTKKGSKKIIQAMTQTATIRVFKGYGVLEADSDSGHAVIQLKTGKASKLKRSPKGGEVVFELAR